MPQRPERSAVELALKLRSKCHFDYCLLWSEEEMILFSKA